MEMSLILCIAAGLMAIAVLAITEQIRTKGKDGKTISKQKKEKNGQNRRNL